MAHGSAENRQTIWTPDQVIEAYPFLNERWVRADHALVYGGERVPDYKEKIDLAGGVDAIRAMLKDVHPDFRKRFLVVLGYEGTPLPFGQSRLFAEKVDIPRDILKGVYGLGTHLRDVELIEKRDPTMLVRVEPNLISIDRINVRGRGISYGIDRPIGHIANPGASSRFASSLS